MSWKEYLIKEKGFQYSELNDDYRIGLGFGRNVTVWMFIKGLFIITKNGKQVYRDFPGSFEEFKKIIDDTIK